MLEIDTLRYSTVGIELLYWRLLLLSEGEKDILLLEEADVPGTSAIRMVQAHTRARQKGITRRGITRRSASGFLWLVVTLLATVVCVSACGGGGGGGGASQPTTTTATTPGNTTSPIKGAPATNAASIQGDFVSLLPDGHTRLALSTDGQQMIAYASDGDDANPPTFAPWFVGSVSDNSVELDSTTSGSDRLVAQLTTTQDATGTLTLKDGTSHTLIADLLSSADNAVGSGLYRGQATFDGVPYLAGWIVDKPEPGDAPKGGGAIVNQQTGELIGAPQLTEEDISAMQVTVPNLGGTFPLRKCHLGTC